MTWWQWLLAWVGVSIVVVLLLARIARGMGRAAARHEAKMRARREDVMRKWSARESGNE
jgi:Na+-transporting methylmalonyl-CoA/oxaloacetate decarboxylase gamma subunit